MPAEGRNPPQAENSEDDEGDAMPADKRGLSPAELVGVSKKKQRAAAKAGPAPSGPASLAAYKHIKNNVLERIAANPHDAWVVWDGQHTMGILEPRPSSHGHTLVVAKQPVATLLDDVSDATLAGTARDVQAAARALHRVTGCSGVRVLQANGPAAGQTIPQLHTNVIPCYDNLPLREGPAAARPELEDAAAGALTAALRNALPPTHAPGFHFWAASAEEMESLGHVLQAALCKPGHVVLLNGQLGAGKSTIARGIVRAHCRDAALDVPSPTFLLCLTYEDDLAHDSEAKAAAEKPPRIHHLDPYRLGKKADRVAGLLDFNAAMAKDVCVIEWPDRMPPEVMALATKGITVHIRGYGSQGAGRLVSLTALPGDDATAATLAAWRSAGLPAVDTPWRSSGATLPALDAGPGGAEEGGTAPRPRRALPANQSEWLVLGIESSCDDTAAAVVRGDGTVLAHQIASQTGLHEQYGGVKPDVARDAHAAAIVGTVDACLAAAGVQPAALTAIAVTVGPGLSLCLQVGLRHALQLGAAHGVPLVPVHHMEAHALVTRMPGITPAPPRFPALLLLVSGGHNMLVLCSGVGKYRIVGTTIDDSVGECFDKTARLLGFSSIPGGPLLERLAARGSAAHKLPMPMQNGAHKDTCNFSFSGLKTSVARLVDEVKAGLGLSGRAATLVFPSDSDNVQCSFTPADPPAPASDAPGEPAVPLQGVGSGGDEVQPVEDALTAAAYVQAAADVAASFTQAAVKFLQQRTSRALQWLKEDAAQQGGEMVTCLVVAGGVAANSAVREGLREVADHFALPCVYPPVRYCTDNGLMVAWTGVERLRLGLFREPPAPENAEKHVDVLPRWPLGPLDPRGGPAAASSKIFG